MAAASQISPSQYSKLFVCELNPKVPVLGFLGLFAVFQEAIMGSPIIKDNP